MLVLVSSSYLVLAVAAFGYNQVTGVPDWPLKHDQVGYFAYLVPLVTDQDWSFEPHTGFARAPATGTRVNPYTPGVAILLFPFFALGHLIALVSSAVPSGTSEPYRLMACIGGATYASCGLIALFAVLRKHFSDVVSTTVVAAIGLGTNLLYYATIEPVMSHSYSFFMFCLVLWAAFEWRDASDIRMAGLVGAGLGLIVLIRPTNAIFGLLPLWVLCSRSRLYARADTALPAGLLLRHAALASTIGLLVTSVLLVYWRFASGHWLYNPHGAGTFFWRDPEVLSVLLSYRKGWFLYTPIMIAVVPGLFMLHRFIPGITLPLLAYSGINLYVVSSWWNWWYGGGFGMRALIESSAPLALAMAAVIATLAASRRGLRSVRVALALLVALNVFQTYQYIMTYIRWDGMTDETYWAVFARPYIPPLELQDIMEGAELEHPRRPKPTAVQ